MQNKWERDVKFWLSASSTVLLVEWLTKACGREWMNELLQRLSLCTTKTITDSNSEMVRERKKKPTRKSTSGHRGPIICHITASSVVIFLIFLFHFSALNKKHRQLLSQTLSLSSPSCLSNHSTYSLHNHFI